MSTLHKSVRKGLHCPLFVKTLYKQVGLYKVGTYSLIGLARRSVLKICYLQASAQSLARMRNRDAQ